MKLQVDQVQLSAYTYCLYVTEITFYVVDYHGKLPVIRKTEGLSADNLILVCKIIF